MGLLDLDTNEFRQYGETLKRFAKTGVDITGMSEDDVIDLSKKFTAARKKAPNEEAVNEIFKKLALESKAKTAADIEKNLVSPGMYEKAMGESAARTAADIEKNLAKPATRMINAASGIGGKVGGVLGKAGGVLSKVAGPAGAALTAFDLISAFDEARKLGAEKIAKEEEAKNSGKVGVKKISVSDKGETTEGPEEMVSTTPITKEEFQGYSPQELERLKNLLANMRAQPGLRR